MVGKALEQLLADLACLGGLPLAAVQVEQRQIAFKPFGSKGNAAFEALGGAGLERCGFLEVVAKQEGELLRRVALILGRLEAQVRPDQRLRPFADLAGPLLGRLGKHIGHRLPRIVGVRHHVAMLQGQCSQPAGLHGRGKLTERPPIAVDVLRQATLDDRPEEAMGQPRHQRRPITTQVGENLLGDPERVRQRAPVRERLAQPVQRAARCLACQPGRPLLQRILGGSGLSVTIAAIDSQAQGRRQASRHAPRIKPLPVLQGPGVVAHVICQHTPQQQLPLEEGGLQTDRLQSSAGIVVAAGRAVAKCLHDGIKSRVLFGRQRVTSASGRALPHRDVGEVAEHALPHDRIAVRSERLHGAGNVARGGEELGNLGAEFRRAAEFQCIAKDCGRVAGVPLLLQLRAAFDQDLTQQLSVLGRIGLFAELAGQLEGLLGASFGPRPRDPIGQRSGRRFCRP